MLLDFSPYWVCRLPVHSYQNIYLASASQGARDEDVHLIESGEIALRADVLHAGSHAADINHHVLF